MIGLMFLIPHGRSVACDLVNQRVVFELVFEMRCRDLLVPPHRDSGRRSVVVEDL
jgi:hypothetical protein